MKGAENNVALGAAKDGQRSNKLKRKKQTTSDHT